MRLLLDTHILLWALTDDPRLSTCARELLLDPANDAFFSAASVWEIAIKDALRPADMPIPAGHAARLFHEAGYEELPISSAHAAFVETLPTIHADPFDRLLVAQAMSEPLRLVTRDKTVASYNDNITLV
jgi:PIN domain nuclease of toxin-antitoxin system